MIATILIILLLLVYTYRIFRPSLDRTDEGDILLWYTPFFSGSRKYIKIY